MKTNEELNAIRDKIENLGNELRELSEQELATVVGGLETNDTIRPIRYVKAPSDLDVAAAKRPKSSVVNPGGKGATLRVPITGTGLVLLINREDYLISDIFDHQPEETTAFM